MQMESGELLYGDNGNQGRQYGERLIGHGVHERFAVQAEKFVSKAGGRL